MTMMAGHVAALPGVRLHYTDSGGAGTPVVMLHPNTGNSDIWDKQVPAFAAAGHRVIAFDRRGWGRSARPHSCISCRCSERYSPSSYSANSPRRFTPWGCY